MLTMQTLPLVVSADELRSRIAGNEMLIVDLSAPEHYAAGHLPNAVPLAYSQIVASQPPVAGLIPDAELLSQILGSIGLSADKQVVAYDDEGGGKAARLIFTLHAAGHFSASLLDGGLPAWREAGGEISQEPAQPERTSYPVSLHGSNVATREDILAQLDDPDLRLLDTRSAGEFSGSDLRAARGGHIPGARHLEWTDLMDHGRHHALRSDDEIRALLAERDVLPEHDVIVYCQTHHRSAHTYIAMRHLGYPRVRGYPGAWSDWGNTPDTPVET